MDFGFWLRHFGSASLVGKGVYLALLGLSIVAWAIIFQKVQLLRRNTAGTRRFLDLYRKGRRDVLALHRQVALGKGRFDSPLAAIFARGCEELAGFLNRGAGTEPVAGSERRKISALQFSTLEKAVGAVEDKYFLDLEHLLTILATTISAAPFLGLLGTVWGILEAFQAMSAQGATGVTTVGAGISEALIATAAGLVVAIPALLGYNFLGARIRELAGEADQFLAEFLALVEREFVRE